MTTISCVLGAAIWGAYCSGRGYNFLTVLVGALAWSAAITAAAFLL